MHGLLRALDDAQPATHALLIQDKGLHFLGVGYLPHLDGFEGAARYTGLAALALLLTDDRLEPAGLHYFMQHSHIDCRMYRHTAAGTAVAQSRYAEIDLIPGLVQKPFFRRFVH
jgi:hypothetical protein